MRIRVGVKTGIAAATLVLATVVAAGMVAIAMRQLDAALAGLDADDWDGAQGDIGARADAPGG